MRVEGKWYRKSERQPKVMQMDKRKKRSVEEFTEAYDKDLPTYIVVHGWKSSTNSDTVQDIKDNYLKTRDCNVIGKLCERVLCMWMKQVAKIHGRESLHAQHTAFSRRRWRFMWTHFLIILFVFLPFFHVYSARLVSFHCPVLIKPLIGVKLQGIISISRPPAKHERLANI